MLYQATYYLPFLVGVFLIYWFVIKSSISRIVFITIASIGFLSIAHPWEVCGLFALTVVVYWAGNLLRQAPRMLYLVLLISVPITVLCVFKYFFPISNYFLQVFQGRGLFPLIVVPLGISYYTFKNVHYLIECSRGGFKNSSFHEYLAYIFFFPMFAAGPIERFNNFSKQIRHIVFSWSDISTGIERIIIGLVKKVLIADFFLHAMLPPADLMYNGAQTLEWYLVLFGCFIKFLITYFDFSGYTDMVLGTARLFGFRLMENFNFPLLRPNLAEFWRAWHISLSSWARDYIYFPILARYRITGMALIATMLMIGIWHGPKPGWALWGLHHGLGLVLLSNFHRWVVGKSSIQWLRAKIVWKFVGIASVWWYVSLGYALTFDAGSVLSSLRLYLKIITFGVI